MGLNHFLKLFPQFSRRDRSHVLSYGKRALTTSQVCFSPADRQRPELAVVESGLLPAGYSEPLIQDFCLRRLPGECRTTGYSPAR
jgi:hypothetical protein